MPKDEFPVSGELTQARGVHQAPQDKPLEADAEVRVENVAREVEAREHTASAGSSIPGGKAWLLLSISSFEILGCVEKIHAGGVALFVARRPCAFVRVKGLADALPLPRPSVDANRVPIAEQAACCRAVQRRERLSHAAEGLAHFLCDEGVRHGLVAHCRQVEALRAAERKLADACVFHERPIPHAPCVNWAPAPEF